MLWPVSRAASPPVVCLDVDYRDDSVVAACVGFHEWNDAEAALEIVVRSEGAAAAYEPGQFWRRELPYLLEVIDRLAALPATVIVDGYVWLGEGRPGLGAHLFESLERRAIVVGVAKTRFRGAGGAIAVPVLRGESKEPLFVTAAGMSVDDAARAVAQMAGPYRVPTLLKRVDRLSRS